MHSPLPRQSQQPQCIHWLVAPLLLLLIASADTRSAKAQTPAPSAPTAAAPTAAGPSEPRSLHFENDIVPILNKFGCNTSGCHGKAEGQNGFKLSVFGSDPEADYRALTMEARGRRVFPAAPDQSLLLRKMSGAAPHGGGVRIEADRPEYSVLREWIRTGMPFGSPDDPRVLSIAITPREQTVAPGQTVALKVVATWSDGRQTDVTATANFQSNQESVARVDAAGVVTAADIPGSAAIMASYLGHVDLFQAFLPRSAPLPPSDPLPQYNFIDRLVDERLQRLRIAPAPPASDAEFLRRVYLDFLGTLPTADEARRFLADARPDRRHQLIDQLLNRPELADYWSLKWADLLRVDRESLGHKGSYELYRWIRQSLAERKPLDQFTRDILLAEGPLAEAPQGQFFRAVAQPGEAAATVSQVFLGVRIACAQCHHHPYDRWSQEDYFGMTAFFAQLQRKPSPWGETLIAEGNPATNHPRTNQAVPPHALGVAPSAEPIPGDRRAVLAKWLTAPDNPWFARNLSNRVWAQLLGRGLVEPVDDFRETNPPSNPALLDALANHLVSNRFEFRELLRVIAQSRVYQQSTKTNSTNADDEQNYSRATLKRLDAEVLLDAVSQTTGVPEKFEGVAAGARAIQLWDSRVDHYFLSLFGRPVRKTACECERNAAPSVAQVLHLLNSERVHGKLSHDAGRVARLVRQFTDDEPLIEELYLTFFSRLPRDEERQAAKTYLQNSPDRRQAAEDLAWSLLNSIEFVFNH